MIMALLFMVGAERVNAQLTIGENKEPETFSQLEIVSGDNTGLRLPQITTTAKRDAILTNTPGFKNNPLSKGLQIFNMETECVEVWNGSKWISMCDGIDIQPVMLELSPANMTFDSNGSLLLLTTNIVTVNTDQSGWTAASSETWCVISGNNGANGQSFAVTTNAYAGTGMRSATITVSAGGENKELVVTQLPPIPVNPITTTTNLYVGAFWRASETEERIIKLPVSGSGLWYASVTEVDDRWSPASGDGILLSTDEVDAVSLAARGIYTANPHPAENLTVGSTSVSGTASSSEPIMFRIGLQKAFAKYASDDNPDYSNTWPARYAVVTVIFDGKSHRIYLRQGEGADYVMRRNDPNGSNVAVDNNRSYAQRFSPYNLKDPANGAPTSVITAGVPNVGIPLGGGAEKFVSFPTQAGHFFRYNYSRQAFSPFTPTGAITNWATAQHGTEFWKASTDETCPTGYRRPQDGVNTSHNTAGAVASSEMRQSLWLNPQAGATSNIDNSVYGYYADGFFDRRQIAGASGSNAGSNSSVSTGNNEIAHRGRLFYNPATNASLFFPAVGHRSDASGSLFYSGNNGSYWSSSTYSAGYTWLLNMEPEAAKQVSTGYYRSRGYTVRCIR